MLRQKNLNAIKAFDRFERSGGGFVVPIVLFTIGAVVTVIACLAIRQLDVRIEKRRHQQEIESSANTIVDAVEDSIDVKV